MTTFVVAFVLSYLFHGLGVTLGYHRLLSHKALHLPKWLEYFVVLGGYLCLEGAPIFWVATHRLHHRYSDQERDPHTPKDGFWHAYIAWMWDHKVQISVEESQQIVPDLYRDPVYRLLDCNHTHWDGVLCLAACIVFRIALFMAFGPIVLAANLAAFAITFNGSLLVNTVAHMKQFGYSIYDAGDGSRNVWFVAMLSLGEGWHNNHHAFPQSARHGLTPKEFDLTWAAISLLRVLGIAKDIRLPKTPSRLVVPETVKTIGTIKQNPKFVNTTQPEATPVGSTKR